MEKYINMRFKNRLAWLDIVEVWGSNTLTTKTQNVRKGLLTDHVKQNYVSMTGGIKANLWSTFTFNLNNHYYLYHVI